jgi:hypothetical protein
MRNEPHHLRHHPQGKRNTVLTALAIIGAVWLLAVGCSGSHSNRTVASLPGGTSSRSSSGAPSVAQSDQDFVDFTRCMRAHGVAMSDPHHRPGHQGLSLDLPPQDGATRTAYAACDHYLASIEQAKAAGQPSVSAAQLQAYTRYAQCMRGHDIPMLDPTPQGQLNLGNVAGVTSDFGRYSPQFRSADGACRHLLPAGVHDDGTGP